MPTWRLQCSIAADTTFPRDKIVITPHFNDQGISSDPQGLCDDLAAALNGWLVTPGAREIKVTAYDAQGTPPVFPQGEAILNPAAAPASAIIREVACCLSFYAGENRPRQRGRLYIPAFLCQAGSTTPLRPILGTRQKVADLAPLFEGLGGTDVDWVVFSRIPAPDGTPRSVTNWWVDDEWDIVRSRGLQPTTRLEGTTSEG